MNNLDINTFKFVAFFIVNLFRFVSVLGGGTRVVPLPEAADREVIPFQKTLYDTQSEIDLTLLTEDKEEYLVKETNSKQIKQYNANTKKWITLMDVPDWVDNGSSWYASEHRVIIAGGDHIGVNADRVTVLDTQVKELPRLPATRHKPGVVVDGDEVYIIGGQVRSGTRSGTATHTMYNANITQNNGWTALPTVPTDLYAPVTSVDADHIYVFGGNDDDVLTHIYNKHTQQWSQGATMPAECHLYRARCISDENMLTVITGDTMMEYHPSDNTWKMLKQYEAECGYISAVSYKGDIISNGIHKENTISRYDADSDDVWVETDIDVSDTSYNNYVFKLYF